MYNLKLEVLTDRGWVMVDTETFPTLQNAKNRGEAVKTEYMVGAKMLSFGQAFIKLTNTHGIRFSLT